MMNTIGISFPLHQELERAKSEGQKEEVANLSSEFGLVHLFLLLADQSGSLVMVIATVAHELAQWIFVKASGFR